MEAGVGQLTMKQEGRDIFRGRKRKGPTLAPVGHDVMQSDILGGTRLLVSRIHSRLHPKRG